MANRELTSLEQMEEYVKEGYGVIDCYGDFCAACVMLEPVFESAVSDMAEIKFGRINVTQCPGIAEKYEVFALPTILFFRDGKEVHRVMGSVDRNELNAQFSVMLYE